MLTRIVGVLFLAPPSPNLTLSPNSGRAEWLLNVTGIHILTNNVVSGCATRCQSVFDIPITDRVIYSVLTLQSPPALMLAIGFRALLFFCWSFTPPTVE